MVERLADAYNGCQHTKHAHAAANGPDHAAAHNAAVHAAIHAATHNAAVHAAVHNAAVHAAAHNAAIHAASYATVYAAIHVAAHNAAAYAVYPRDLPVLYNSVTAWWQYVAVTNGSMCNGEFL